MSNEETIIMQPQNNNQAQQVQNVDTPKQEEKNTGKGKNIAAMTGAAVFGGAAGGAGTAAAANLFTKEQEVKVEEETPAATTTAKPEQEVEEKTETKVTPVTTDEHGEPDYTGHGGADPVTPQPQLQQTSNDSNETQEVQVLGVYHNDEGQEAAVLTDGETVAVVLDANGDGEANVIGIDENHNNQFDEGEVHDISDQHIGMGQFEDAYFAQQEEQLQQEHDTFAYNASEEADYNNDAEVYDA